MNMRNIMSMDSDGKVVQTRLGTDEYERLRRVADAEGLSLKEALRRAATEFAATHARHDPDDPFFAEMPDEGEVDGEDLTATETESYLYGEE